MKFREYKKKIRYNLDEIAAETGIPKSTLGKYSTSGKCKVTRHAKTLIDWSKGEITLEDLV